MHDVPFTKLQGIFGPRTDMTLANTDANLIGAPGSGPSRSFSWPYYSRTGSFTIFSRELGAKKMGQSVKYHKILNIHVSLDKHLQ
jgi:hypothetical protein